MNRTYITIAVVALLAYYGVTHYVWNPNKPTGPDMIEAFSKDALKSGYEARQDAKQFAALCQSLHDTLLGDWQQATPYIKDGVQVDTLRIVSRRIYAHGKSYNDAYPGLKAVLDKHFAKHIDSHYGPLKGSGGPLTAEVRASWLEAFQELADCSYYAAENL